ncbi:hypothetical protein KL933_000541 [Ogataea haglerorum]|uniref:Uncharacterized protein n=1 Tax=Ogataea haglerorum TaxID=1937702 RepID=A0AAN6I2Q5_9ASCO|nr:hypothetical protein KL915_000799 [Ogataea haglerorum]KAG7711581.1 hypothetical protein KL914_000223 [Ogataea haglerorum]KAG7712352.1 hypothetical protein KL950_000223 [Ogataea haglerorum]KAG7730746.1 hypothetical protein KL933_000541 [Ogataea haglerorum]KAG7734658.1 hypothetical protein KL948_000224 [Ogataea haglerorum]
MVRVSVVSNHVRRREKGIADNQPQHARNTVLGHHIQTVIHFKPHLELGRVVAHHSGYHPEYHRRPQWDAARRRRRRHKTGDDARTQPHRREVVVDPEIQQTPGDSSKRSAQVRVHDGVDRFVRRLDAREPVEAQPSEPQHRLQRPAVRTPDPVRNGTVNESEPEKREDHRRKHAAALAHRPEQNANGDGGKHALEVGKGHLWVAFLVVSESGQNAEVLVPKVVQVANEFVAGGRRERQRVSPEVPLELGNANGCEGDEYHVQSRLSPGKARVEIGQTEAHHEH